MDAQPRFRIKRVYDPAEPADGRRFLVERLWPRGMRKEALDAEAWLKEAAPSAALRTWFDHRAERWLEFRKRYRAELASNPAAWRGLLEAARTSPVTLLYSAHDADHNSALVLQEYLARRRMARPRARAPVRPPPSSRARARR